MSISRLVIGIVVSIYISRRAGGKGCALLIESQQLARRNYHTSLNNLETCYHRVGTYLDTAVTL